MVLWATYYGANYRYLIEYGLGDDGMISCRIGPTGRNIFNRQEDQRDTQMYIGCWPMAFDLLPHRFGALRQLQPEGGTYATDMDFINYDFWVTRTESAFTSYIEV